MAAMKHVGVNVAADLTPARDAPIAASKATFSLGAHSQYNKPLYRAIFSRISVLGVPGYAEAKIRPAS
jgi:hypothetical protein